MINQNTKIQNQEPIQVTQESIAGVHKTTEEKTVEQTREAQLETTSQKTMEQPKSVTATANKQDSAGELQKVWGRIDDNMPPVYKKKLTKSEARKAGDNMVNINEEFEGFMAKNPIKYLTKAKTYNVGRAFKDYLLGKSNSISVSGFTDADLKKQPTLKIYNRDLITFDNQEISETDKRLALFNSNDEFNKLPLRKQAAYRKKMEAYRKARIAQAKAYNRVKGYNSVVTEAKQLMENDLLKNDQKLAALDMASYAGDLTEKEFTEYGSNNLSETEKGLQNEIESFAKWRVENDVLLTAGDRRWKEYRKFADTFDDSNENHRIIKVSYGSEIREISVIDGQYLGEGELSLTATSDEELERICDDIQKMNAHFRDSIAARAYSASKNDTEKALKGSFKLEFDAMVKLRSEAASDLFDKCFNADKPEVIHKVVGTRLKEFENAKDYKGAADYMLECALKGEKNMAYTEAYLHYIEKLSAEVMDMKKLKDRVPAEEDYLLAVANRLCLIDKRTRFAAGKEMAATEERIKKGEIKGCELLNKKQITKTAHDIVHSSEIGARYFMAYSCYQACFQYINFGVGPVSKNKNSDVFYDQASAVERDIIREEMEKDPSLTEKKIKEYLSLAGDQNFALDRKDFKLKDDWNGEGSPFEVMPEEFSKVKNTATDKLYEQKAELEEKVTRADNYEKEVGNTVAAYRLYFTYLKNIGIDFRKAPPEYVELYKAFDNVQRLGMQYRYKHKSQHFILDGMSSVRTDAALAEIKLAAENFLNAPIKISSRDVKKYEDLREILSDTLKFTEGEQARYKEIHKGFTGASTVTIDESQKSLEKINKELVFRGEKDVIVKEAVKPKFQCKVGAPGTEMRESVMEVMGLIAKMKSSNSRVIGGSSEFDKALDGASTLFEIGSKVGDAIVYGTPEEVLRTSEGSETVLASIEKNLEAYLARKKKQGKSETKGDEKSKERIKYVNQLSEMLENIRKNINISRNSILRKKKDPEDKTHKEYIAKLSDEIHARWTKLDEGDRPKVEEPLDPVAQKYQASLKEFNNDNFEVIQELKDELAVIRAKEAEYDEAIRDLYSNWAPESKIKELKNKKYKEISKLKETYKAKLKSKNIYDFGQSVDYDSLDPATYTEELKEQYIKVLKDHGCRVGRNRAANVEFRGKYFMNDPVALDYVWRPGVEQEVKDAYEWLVQYYTVHDKTIEKKGVVAKKPVKLKMPKYKIELADIDQIVREYEKQPSGTNNCFACAGAEMYRQFCRKEGRLSKAVTQFDIRKYRPKFKSFEDYKREVEELEPRVDQDMYNMYVKETNGYLVGGRVGNIFEMGDFFISKQKDAVLKKTTLHVPAVNDNMTSVQKKDRKVIYHNTKVTFLDKVYEGLSGGHVVTVLTSHPMRHYRTIVGIDGENIKYVDSFGSAHGSLQTAKVGDIFLPDDNAALNVELVWMEKANINQIQADYKNLSKDENEKRINKEPTVEELSMVAQTKGVNVSKGNDDPRYEGVHMRDCVYLSK